MHYGRSCIWLGLGAVLLAVGSRSSAFPLAMWLALALLLRAARTLPPWPGGPFLLTALYVALAIGNRGVLPVGDPLYFLVITAIGVPTLLPFAADRLLARRVPGWAATLAFPAAWVAVELVNARLAPGGTWGSIAYSQYGNLPLMQLAALTGLGGISFLVAWFAPVANAAWERGLAWPAVQRIVLPYAAILVAVTAGGALRVALAPRPARPLRTAVVSFPTDFFVPGEVTRFQEGHLDASEGSPLSGKLARLHAFFLDGTEREARAGARLVAWPETNLLVTRADEPAFLERARRLAAERRVAIAMGMGTVEPGARRPLQNKLVLVDDSGRTVFSYDKSRPVPGWEASLVTPGTGRLPVVDTNAGRIAAAICFDADFPDLVHQAGEARAELFVLSANDWEAIKHFHLEMAAFRAIENGVPVLRATSRGISAAFDPWGRLLAATDHFSGARTMVAIVPVGAVPTVYARVGDAFAWLCVGALALSTAFGLSRRST